MMQCAQFLHEALASHRAFARCDGVRNEAATLAESLESLRGRADEIVVVDGGSTDASVAIAEAAGARVSVDRGDVAAGRFARRNVPFAALVTYRDLGIEPVKDV